MSIKEYLRQTIANEPDNIRDIKIPIEKKQKELPFDPDEEITKSDWNWLLSYVQGEKNASRRVPIMAAHEVKVTEKGLEITMLDPKEEYREERPPRPVRLSPSLRGV